MNTNRYTEKKVIEKEDPSKVRNQVDYLQFNVFKPPRYDTEFFYYTEVYSDWVERK